MKKIFKILPLFLVVSLTACSEHYVDTLFCFDTVVTVKTKGNRGYSGQATQGETCQIIKEFDALSDAYKKRDVTSIYDLNSTNEKLEISEELYNLLYTANELKAVGTYFNPLIGSLSNKWKDALSKNEILSETVVQEELTKINNSSLTLEINEDKYYAQRTGEALIDVGAIAKGYTLDKCEEYLRGHTDSDHEYMIDAGNSSILLGANGGSTFGVHIKDLSKPTHLKLKDCFISSSGTSEQGVKIGEVTYSHIINPNDGSAINLYDAVIVVSSNTIGNGALGDVLSTSFMMSSLEEIKETEKNTGVNVLVIKDDNIVYSSESLKL